MSVAFSGVLPERHFELADEAATEAFGARLAHALYTQCAASAFTGMQIHLQGELGAGKTALVRATLRALGHTGRVRSPTYTLVEPYAVPTPHGELRLYHFDLYRFSDPSEWIDAGLHEYFGSGAVCFVEWPQRAQGQTGVPDLVFALEYGMGGGANGVGDNDNSRGEGRVLHARAYSQQGTACLERC